MPHMARLLGIFGFLSVLLRAATLCFQTLAVGGIVFVVVALRDRELRTEPILQSIRRWITVSALALAVTQIVSVVANLLILMESADMSLAEAIGANFVIASGLSIAASLTIAIATGARGWRGNPALLLPAILILAGAVMTSHSASRMEYRWTMVGFTALHHAATATWIGGLPYLLLASRRASDPCIKKKLSANFSQVALASVAVLAGAGLALGVTYVGSWNALYGTAYGVMVSAKVLLFGILLILGAFNFWIVRRMRASSGPQPASLLRFGEAEIGIGLAVILAAASLTSQPPAADLTAGRVTPRDIFERYAPKWPRMTSSSFQDLPEPSLQIVKRAAAAGIALPNSYVPGQAVPNLYTPADIAWSEYNHHWAGIIVLAIGLLALAARTGRVPWARNWPLTFLVLAVFLFIRSDPENWPLGPNGFWESFLAPDVLQHRVFVVLLILFAIFEWRVVTNRAHSRAAALVFPAICALGGAFLLTHSHSVTISKEDVLAEISHVPLAILGVVAGWSRWLELRLPQTDDRTRRILSWVWPVCFILIGLVLLDYRGA